MRIVYMGTPDFAVHALSALKDEGHEIALVVTQPDKPKGRKGTPVFSPVKAFALDAGLPVFQPERVREPEAVKRLAETGAELFVVAAFGQILSAEVLELPPLGCVNLHASLLPKLRGAAPVQAAILEGERETGITVMQMDEGLDTGDILYQEAIPIGENETAGELSERLSRLSASCIVKALPLLARGELKRRPQDENGATYASKLTKQSGRIDWKTDAATLSRLIRATNPWPGAFTSVEKKQLKLFAATASGENSEDVTPGTVMHAGREGLCVQTGDGQLLIREVQLEGKKRMPTEDFLRGFPVPEGLILGL